MIDTIDTETTEREPHDCRACPHICPGCGAEVVVDPGVSNSIGLSYIARPVFCGMPSCFANRIRQVWASRGYRAHLAVVVYNRDGIQVETEAARWGKGVRDVLGPRRRVTGGWHRALKLVNVTQQSNGTVTSFG